MIQKQRFATVVFSIGMFALGVIAIIARDFAFGWQPVPAFHPGREALAVVCGFFMIAASVAMLFRATAAIAARAIFPFLVVWFGLKVPALVVAPKIEGVWLGAGEIGMLLAGGWVLFAGFAGIDESGPLGGITGRRGLRISQIIFGISVIPVGLGHVFYPGITVSLIPAWMPLRVPLAYATGIMQIGCGLAILFSVVPRVAALLETTMLALFALLVWGPDTWFASTPKMAGTPSGARFPLTAFLITWVIGGASLLIADSFPSASGQASEERG